jgi:hypothetical protein
MRPNDAEASPDERRRAALEDARLQSALRALPLPTESADLNGLNERIMAQWQERHGVPEPVVAGRGPALALAGRWGRHPMWIVALGLLASAAIVLGVWLQRPDPVLEELMQPDVLSQMAAGQL